MPPPPLSLASQTLQSLSSALAAGLTTSRALVEAALAAIASDDRAFTVVDIDEARAAADLSDQHRAQGVVASVYAGLPISVKDLFDQPGQPTAAGSLALRTAPPAVAEAPTIARLTAAGLIVVGRTQMSEFAFTGLGLNPHAPLLPNPKDAARAPGGSSSGAAVSVALGQACAAIGTDTGGSVRIPAAFCGLVGFKPTQRRLTREGVLPLSTTLDSIGPIAHSVACCQALDAVMADRPVVPHRPVSPTEVRLGVPKSSVVNDVDQTVSAAFDQALSRLSAAGVQIEAIDLPELDQIPRLAVSGSISNAEAFAWHRRRNFFGRRDLYDPNVLSRIDLGGQMSAADYLDLLTARAAMIVNSRCKTAGFSAIVFPTTATPPPRLDALSVAADFARINGLVLRNPSVVNFLDRCAISLPIRVEGDLPCGLTLMGETLGDERLLSVAQSLETIVS